MRSPIDEMSLESMIAEYASGDLKFRRMAVARIMDAKDALRSPKFKTMRIVGGPEWVATLERSIANGERMLADADKVMA